MFGRKYKGRRPFNILFVTFRMLLSLAIFAILLIGMYSAYKHFSGLDPLKASPQAFISSLVSLENAKKFLATIPTFKLTQNITEKESKALSQQQPSPNQSTKQSVKPATSKLILKFMLIADSHSDNINLKKAILQGKKDYPDIKFIVGMGDYTEVGTIDELKSAKKEFDNSGLRYFLVVGDHDLWDCRNRSAPPNCNFREVFGPSYQSFSFDNFDLIILYNSDNYLGMDQEQLNWVSSELNKAKNDQTKSIYVFLHEPLYHPSSDHVMGRVESKLKQQAKELINQFKENGVKKVFAGDIHYFTEYVEPQTGLAMVTVGAITSQRNAQAPRFAIVKVFEDGSTTVDDVEIK